MNKINKQSKKLFKSLKGKIDTPSLVKYLETIGYSVVFFNTEDGDELLNAYDLNPKNAKAFTYCGATKIVFVDSNLHTSDKIYSLLHECGHILLGHIGKNSIELLNKRSTENEAEAFCYAVLNYNRTANIQSVSLFVVTFLLVLSVMFSVHTNIDIPEEIPAVKNITVSEHETVYITPTGSKYHLKSCPSIKNSVCAKIEKSEAEKIHKPCGRCNP